MKQTELEGLILRTCWREIKDQGWARERFRRQSHRLAKESQKVSPPSSSPPSSAEDPEAVNSSFHFRLFLGGGSARGFGCLGRGFWLWETEEGVAVKPSKVFI